MGYFVKNRRLQSGSTGVILPTGSTIQRPEFPAFGLIRYNTDSGMVEYFDGTMFQSLLTGANFTYVVDNFTGDGVSTTFGPMSQAVANASNIIVFIGGIYQIPVTNYTVNGTVDITFTSAPPLNATINVIHTQG